MKVNNFSKEEDFLDQLEHETVNFLNERVARRGLALIGLSGGKTPGNFYLRLGENTSLPWEDLTFIQVDERFVDKTESRSNYNMLVKTLFANNPGKNYIKYLRDFDTSLNYEDCIRSFLRMTSPLLEEGIDLCILGIGKDGHFASIFPGTDLEDKRPVFGTITEQFEVQKRMTLSASTILKSKKIFVLLKGKEKAGLVEKIKNSEVSNDFPASLLKGHSDVTFYLLES